MKTARTLLLQQAFRCSEWLAAAQTCGRTFPPNPRRCLVLSAYTPNLSEIGRIADKNKRQYAERHGYAYHSHQTGFAATRPPAWSKVRFILEALTEYEWVFWTDADALIMNLDIRLEQFMVPGVDVRLTRAGCPIPHLNTGQMLFRASAFSRFFLRSVWRLEVFTHDSTWEQRAVNHLCASYRFHRLAIVPNRLFNAFAGVPEDPAPYQPGDFIVHFPGVSDKPRRMAEFAAQILPHD